MEKKSCLQFTREFHAGMEPVETKFYPGMKFYLFHLSMKFLCKQNFSSRDEISSPLHVNQDI